MIIWGIRITGFITNSAVLVAYAFLYSWLLNNKQAHYRKHRIIYLSALVWATLLLFHFASVFSMADAKNPTGFGWNYINFQVCAIIFALFDRPPRTVMYGIITLLTIWYIWIPRVTIWPLIECFTIFTIWIMYQYEEIILATPYLYLLFCYLFVAPFYLTNYLSLDGIDIGWGWLLLSFTAVALATWFLQKRFRQIREHEAMLVKKASIDELTRLNNFRVFDEDLQRTYFNMVHKNDGPIALFTLDIDHFKRINDRYGHLIGNVVLETVAQRLNELSQTATDYPAKTYRTGGEEFSIITFGITEDITRARTFAELIRTELAKLKFTTAEGEQFSITISLGEDHSLPDDQSYLDVYKRADKYLYNSKTHGRNAITLQGQIV